MITLFGICQTTLAFCEETFGHHVSFLTHRFVGLVTERVSMLRAKRRIPVPTGQQGPPPHSVAWPCSALTSPGPFPVLGGGAAHGSLDRLQTSQTEHQASKHIGRSPSCLLAAHVPWAGSWGVSTVEGPFPHIWGHHEAPWKLGDHPRSPWQVAMAGVALVCCKMWILMTFKRLCRSQMENPAKGTETTFQKTNHHSQGTYLILSKGAHNRKRAYCPMH